MKLILIAALAASFAVPAGSAPGNMQSDTIQVRGEAAMTRWAQGVSRKLDRNLRYPWHYAYTVAPQGTVSVSFACGENGSPSGVTLFDSSGHRSLDRAAIQAVTQIKGLHPLPDRMQQGQIIRANIIFAEDEASLERQIDKLRQAEVRRIAQDRRDGRVVVVIAVGRRHTLG